MCREKLLRAILKQSFDNMLMFLKEWQKWDQQNTGEDVGY